MSGTTESFEDSFQRENGSTGYSAEQISDIEVWCNSLPGKILGYRTPDEVFEEELDRIYRSA